MHKATPIDRYGVRLQPLTVADLETVRQWRNAEHVRSKMEYQAIISPEMQAQWWAELDLERNHYCMILFKAQPIGVIHAKDIDWKGGVAETGIFIGEVAWLGSMVPVCAVLALMDTLFEVHGLGCLQAKVKADAPQIVAFNQRLGYAVVSEAGGFQRMQVGRAAYLDATRQLRAMAARWAETAT
jgi:RimJ/RimL family protein N-acetyltransferase